MVVAAADGLSIKNKWGPNGLYRHGRAGRGSVTFLLTNGAWRPTGEPLRTMTSGCDVVGSDGRVTGILDSIGSPTTFWQGPGVRARLGVPTLPRKDLLDPQELGRTNTLAVLASVWANRIPPNICEEDAHGDRTRTAWLETGGDKATVATGDPTTHPLCG